MLKANRNSVIDLESGKQLAVVVPSNATKKDANRWAQYIVDRVNADLRSKKLSQGKSNLKQKDAEIARLKEALRTSSCPKPIFDDDGTVGCCVDRNHCGCDNKQALGL